MTGSSCIQTSHCTGTNQAFLLRRLLVPQERKGKLLAGSQHRAWSARGEPQRDTEPRPQPGNSGAAPPSCACYAPAAELPSTLHPPLGTSPASRSTSEKLFNRSLRVLHTCYETQHWQCAWLPGGQGLTVLSQQCCAKSAKLCSVSMTLSFCKLKFLLASHKQRARSPSLASPFTGVHVFSIACIWEAEHPPSAQEPFVSQVMRMLVTWPACQDDCTSVKRRVNELSDMASFLHAHMAVMV